MPRYTYAPLVLISAALIAMSVYLAVGLQMTTLLLLPPLFTCLLGFLSPRWVGVGASMLSGIALMLFLDPFAALFYTMAGSVFGLFVYALALQVKRPEIIVVQMGMYMGALYMAYMVLAREWMGFDLQAALHELFVARFATELSALGVNAAELIAQMMTMSFGGIFVLGAMMAIWSLYMGALLVAMRGIPVLVPDFLTFRLKELHLLPLMALFGLAYLLALIGGVDIWGMSSNLLFILLFLFCLQGVSFIAWWRAKRGKKNRLFYLLAVVLFFVPMGQISLGLVGFIENMTQLRKIGG